MFGHKSADVEGIVGRLLSLRAERGRATPEDVRYRFAFPTSRVVPREMAYPAMHFMRLVR